MAEIIKPLSGAVNAADPITQKFEFQANDGRQFIFTGGDQRIVIKNGNEEIGWVVKSSKRSGSLWKKEKCIAEYYLEEKNYRVVPISEGTLNSDATEKIHPIDFLIHE